MIVFYGYKHSLLYWLLIGWWWNLTILPFKIMWWTVKLLPKIAIKVGLYSLIIGGGIIFVALYGSWLAIGVVFGLGYGILKLFLPKKA